MFILQETYSKIDKIIQLFLSWQKKINTIQRETQQPLSTQFGALLTFVNAQEKQFQAIMAKVISLTKTIGDLDNRLNSLKSPILGFDELHSMPETLECVTKYTDECQKLSSELVSLEKEMERTIKTILFKLKDPSIELEKTHRSFTIFSLLQEQIDLITNQGTLPLPFQTNNLRTFVDFYQKSNLAALQDTIQPLSEEIEKLDNKLGQVGSESKDNQMEVTLDYISDYISAHEKRHSALVLFATDLRVMTLLSERITTLCLSPTSPSAELLASIFDPLALAIGKKMAALVHRQHPEKSDKTCTKITNIITCVTPISASSSRIINMSLGAAPVNYMPRSEITDLTETNTKKVLKSSSPDEQKSTKKRKHQEPDSTKTTHGYNLRRRK